MITIQSTKDNDIITSIITEPQLWDLEYGQGMGLKDFQVDWSYRYLLIKDNEEILGLFQVRDFTRIVLEAHIYLLPKYWGNTYSKDSIKALIKYLTDMTHYHSLITDVPVVCKHVINLLKKIGARQSGFINNGVIYNNKLTDLMLFSYQIKRG